MQKLGKFQIWQLFLPTAAGIIAGISNFCTAGIVARGKCISTCGTYGAYLPGGYLFQAGVHTCSDLVCLEILGHLS